jgi:hypothetical protein
VLLEQSDLRPRRAHEIVVGHDARLAGLQAKARVPGRADQAAVLLDEAINRALVRGPVDPLIGDLDHPQRVTSAPMVAAAVSISVDISTPSS